MNAKLLARYVVIGAIVGAGVGLLGATLELSRPVRGAITGVAIALALIMTRATDGSDSYSTVRMM